MYSAGWQCLHACSSDLLCSGTALALHAACACHGAGFVLCRRVVAALRALRRRVVTDNAALRAAPQANGACVLGNRAPGGLFWRR